MSTSRFHEGDRGKAICSSCEKLVGTTFVRRDVSFSDGGETAKNILVAICNLCGEVVAIPGESTVAIRAARDD